MKIESSKTTQAENRTEKKAAPSGKSETAFRSLFDEPQKTDSQTKTAGFARILDEARNQNVKDKDSLFERKNERSEQSSETTEADTGKETNKTIQNQEKVEDEGEQSDGSDEQSDEHDNNAAFALPNLLPAMKPTAEIVVPAARSIMHVADLERIVSIVRAQNLKNVEQVVIALKHSVLEGLQIKLTITENGVMKAEFLASSEQIKIQLNARKQEIRQIFRERGIKLSDLNIRHGSEFAGSPNQSESDTSLDKNEKVKTTGQAAETDISDNQSGYRI